MSQPRRAFALALALALLPEGAFALDLGSVDKLGARYHDDGSPLDLSGEWLSDYVTDLDYERAVRAFLVEAGELYGLTDEQRAARLSQLLLVSDDVNEAGSGTLRFEQVYAGLPVHDGLVVALFESARLRAVAGHLVGTRFTPIPNQGGPLLEESKAKVIAKAQVAVARAGVHYDDVLPYAAAQDVSAHDGRVVWRVDVASPAGEPVRVVLDAVSGAALRTEDVVVHDHDTDSARMNVVDCERPDDGCVKTTYRTGRSRHLSAVDRFQLERHVEGSPLERSVVLFQVGESAPEYVRRATNTFNGPWGSYPFMAQQAFYWADDATRWFQEQIYGRGLRLEPSVAEPLVILVANTTGDGSTECDYLPSCGNFYRGSIPNMADPSSEYASRPRVVLCPDRCGPSFPGGVPPGTAVVHEVAHYFALLYGGLDGVCGGAAESRALNEAFATWLGALHAWEHSVSSGHRHERVPYEGLRSVNQGRDFDAHDCQHAARVYDLSCSSAYEDMIPLVQALWEIAFDRVYSTTACGGARPIGFGSVGAARRATLRASLAALRNTAPTAGFRAFGDELVRWLDVSDPEGGQRIAENARAVLLHHNILVSYVP